MNRLSLIASLLFIFSPALAEADAIVAILPAWVEQDGSKDIAERANHVLLEHFSRAPGMEGRVIGASHAKAFATCRDTLCGRDAVRSLGTQFVALTAVFAPRETNSSGSVTFLVVDEEARHYATSTGLTPSIKFGLETAAQSLIQSLRRGPGPWLTVRGQPSGAAIQLNGTVIGTVPDTIRVPPGEHALFVRKRGFKSQRQNVLIHDEAGEELVVEVALVPGADARESLVGSPLANPRMARAALVTAVAGMAVSAFFFVDGIRSLQKSGMCSLSTDEYCRDWGGPKSMMRVVGGVSGLAVGAGIVTWSAWRIALRLNASERVAGVQMRRSF